ncbi:sensor histidine kinase [Ancylomarina longa]|uniref:Signal transduction histidine kinase internal region domain-containing protein n=1 Tax=Ancylomarina longa TaxID=2487017 RepID=A0A434AV74_9BACT|nr:histidine kinase [Ancylomarina longa]RUT78259.1 hypothetical protein DLK05_09285 [Ancylomarina longa]
MNSNHLKRLLVVLITFGFISTIFANIQKHQSFSMKDGLPSNNVEDIFQDSHDVVWLATYAGLYEFTGSEIKFRSDLIKLQGERISDLCQLGNGDMLISVLGKGLFLFDGKSLTFLSRINKNLNCEINCLFADSLKNRILLGTTEGLIVLEKGKRGLVRNNNSNFRNINISKIRKIKDGFILYGNDNFPNLPIPIRFDRDKIIELSTADHIPTIELDYTILDSIDIGAQLWLKLPDKTLLCDILETVQNHHTKAYLLRYFQKGVEHRKVLTYDGKSFKDLSSASDLNSFFIQTLYGENDNWWMGTREQGLIFIPKSNFKYFDVKIEGIKNIKINDIASNKTGGVYLSTNSEILIFNDDVQVNRIKTEQLCKLISKKNICNCELKINNIAFDKEDKLWISSNKGFFTLNPRNFSLNYKGITSSENFIITGNGELLCHHKNELRFYSIDGKILDKPIYKFPKSSEIEISKILEKGNEVWIATKQMGILYFHEGHYQIFNRSNSGIHNIVNDMLFISDSTIIAGGNNGVIYKISIRKNQLEVIDSLSKRDGLKGVSIHGFQYLKDGSLWCGTNEGVHRFVYDTWHNDSTLDYRFWNAKDGYFDQTGNKSVVDKNQNIWVQTNNKLLKINTKLILVDESKRQLVLSKVQVRSQKWEMDSSRIDFWTKSPLNPIKLGYKENFVNFEFSYNFCENPSNVLYQYRLDGLEEKWTPWTDSNKTIYSNLPSGTYTLMAKAKNLSETSISDYSIEIQIETPWWRLWWFRIFLFLSIVFVLFICLFIYVRKIKRIEKRRTKQFRRNVGLKIKALQMQLGPHFLFNSLNSIQSYILEGKQELALEYLSDFSMVLRQNIDNANKDNVSLSEELTYLKYYLKLEQMRYSHCFKYEIEIGLNINPLTVKLPPMLIQPFLENAIKFGIGNSEKEGNLQISFQFQKDEYLKCVITDNGIGRKESKTRCTEREYKSYCEAVQITKNRIKLLNQVHSNGNKFYYQIDDMEDVSNSSAGTRVELGFPKIY